MADSPRARRLAGRIRQIVASYLETQVKDPRLGMVTITDVRMTGDLHDASIFYTVYGGEAERADSAAAIEAARGQMRTEVGRQTGVKFTPTLTFFLDVLPESAKHIDDLLAVARQADAEVERVRAGARPAGDPDPYRKPRDADADPGADPGADAGADAGASVDVPAAHAAAVDAAAVDALVADTGEL
ncbi:30S ribosome-binding factor RbfA [Jatrophihabitans telluris]|uniref:Ribosome-binding factor A n=1 Tax=Jatrophihabitans telluris TaxID=2038343 RepID=A0ABY4R555_9ACTN|nr:30S ribosome-binding factor RbfA [Jatrophihabitans telluris]UQX90045.1 30S ribosome-binding factor RbfA [Jatrophihabitans telluris]